MYAAVLFPSAPTTRQFRLKAVAFYQSQVSLRLLKESTFKVLSFAAVSEFFEKVVLWKSNTDFADKKTGVVI